MKFSWDMALWPALCIFLLAGCAEMHQSPASECSRDVAYARGASDGASGHKAKLAFLHNCGLARTEALAAYRESYSRARIKRRSLKIEAATDRPDEIEDKEEMDSESSPLVPPPYRETLAVSWVCEIEASSKVFTGVGATRDEAFDSARSTCGSHFQASYCTRADCKQNL